MLSIPLSVVFIAIVHSVQSWPTTMITTPQIESSNTVRSCGLTDADQLADQVMPLVQRRLSERHVELAFRSGIVNLGPGELFGLKTLNRSGPMDQSCNDTYLVLSLPLATSQPIRARYDWDKIVAGKNERGLAHARASSFKGRVTLARPLNETNVAFRVIDAQMTPSDDVEVNVSGLAHISWLWSRAIKFMTSALLKAMCTAANQELRHVFDDAFASYDGII